jgi:hypothetical protein
LCRDGCAGNAKAGGRDSNARIAAGLLDVCDRIFDTLTHAFHQQQLSTNVLSSDCAQSSLARSKSNPASASIVLPHAAAAVLLSRAHLFAIQGSCLQAANYMRQCESLVTCAFKNKESYMAACDAMTLQLKAAAPDAAPSALTTSCVVNPISFKTSTTLLPLIK